MARAVQEETKVEEEPPASSSSSSSSSFSSPVLVESKKQNSIVSPALLIPRHKKQGTSPQNAFLSPSPILLNACSSSGNNTQFPAARYKSPTDSLISPISRGLLAIGRKAMKPTPAFVPPKVLNETYDVSEIRK